MSKITARGARNNLTQRVKALVFVQQPSSDGFATDAGFAAVCSTGVSISLTAIK